MLGGGLEGENGEVSGAMSRRMFMHTLGVDLSVTRRRTAVVSVEWSERCATVGAAVVGPSDEDLAVAVADAEWVGLSGPFGWPGEMVSALQSYATVGSWPSIEKGACRYRRTDVFVHDFLLEEMGRKVWPLSVSSDGVALTAWRLGRLGEEVSERSGVRFDRCGGDGVVEVFPGAALLLWGFERGVYRRGEGVVGEDMVRQAREEFVSSVEAAAPWLKWAGDARGVCIESEDAVDGVICGLVARAAALGMTKGVGEGLEDNAGREGWVHLPEKDGLAALVGGEVEAVAGV